MNLTGNLEKVLKCVVCVSAILILKPDKSVLNMYRRLQAVCHKSHTENWCVCLAAVERLC